MVWRLAQQLAVGTGAAGAALVDTTSRLKLDVGVDRFWGRRSEFDDTEPGTFTVVLENFDGDLTPGNPASSLTTTLTEGMQVCWDLGGRLVAGTILAIEPSFPSANASWAQVSVTCDDMLGNAARHELTALEGAAQREGIVTWPLEDAAGSLLAVGTSAVGPAPYLAVDTSLGGTVTFGVLTSGFPDAEAAMKITQGAVSSAPSLTSVGPFPALTYPPGVVGAWGYWASPSADVARTSVIVGYLTALPGLTEVNLRIGSATTAAASITDGVATAVSSVVTDWSVPHYLSCYVTQGGTTTEVSYTVELFVDGVSAGESSYTPSPAVARATVVPPKTLTISGSVIIAVGPGSTTTLGRITHSVAPINDGLLTAATAGNRISALSAPVTDLVLDTFPTFSTAIYAPDDPAGSSVLDAVNGVVRAEQAAIYSVTTGTLTAPVEKVTFRARDRVAAVDYMFNVDTEASGGTDFIRDITNMAQTVTADGPALSASYTNTDLDSRASAKNVSESVPLRDYVDLFTWATDRSARGANVDLRAASLTIDAMTTPTDRTADLLALVPGDRIQITDLPSAQLGFSTWDGWLLGVDEHQSLTEHTFTLYLQPCGPDTGIYDTARFMAGGVLTLSANINAAVTSISVATSDTLTKFTTAGGDFPITIIIGDEEMTVTGCTSATPQVATVTRGVNGTTAASHSAGDVVELTDDYDSFFGF